MILGQSLLGRSLCSLRTFRVGVGDHLTCFVLAFVWISDTSRPDIVPLCSFHTTPDIIFTSPHQPRATFPANYLSSIIICIIWEYWTDNVVDNPSTVLTSVQGQRNARFFSLVLYWHAGWLVSQQWHGTLTSAP